MITSLSKQSWTLALFVSLLFGFILSFWPKSSFSQTVLSQQQAGSILAIEKVSAQGDGTVTGEIRNQSKNTVRDPQLFIRYTFLWKNEFHPGKESPSQAFYTTISGEIAPGGSLPFKFTPSPAVAETFGRHDSKRRLFPSQGSRRSSRRASDHRTHHRGLDRACRADPYDVYP